MTWPGPHTFADGPGNTASGVEVMDNFEYLLGLVQSASVPGGPGTSLPGSPVDGEEYFYVAGAGVVWHLKYDGGSSKWRFIGGPPLLSEVTAAVATVSTSYAALSGSAGPTIAVPKSGSYIVTLGALITDQLGEGNPIMSYDIGGTGAVDADGVLASGTGQPMAQRQKALTAVTLTAKYKVPTSGGFDTPGGTFARRTLSILPVTIG